MLNILKKTLFNFILCCFNNLNLGIIDVQFISLNFHPINRGHNWSQFELKLYEYWKLIIQPCGISFCKIYRKLKNDIYKKDFYQVTFASVYCTNCFISYKMTIINHKKLKWSIYLMSSYTYDHNFIVCIFIAFLLNIFHLLTLLARSSPLPPNFVNFPR